MHHRLIDQLVSAGLLTAQQAFVARLEGAAALAPSWRRFLSEVSATYEALEAQVQAHQQDAVAALPRQSFPLALVCWGPDGRVAEWNPAASALFGYGAATASSLDGIAALVCSDDHPMLEACLRGLFKGTPPAPLRLGARRADGERQDALWTFSLARGPDGEPVSVAAFIDPVDGNAAATVDDSGVGSSASDRQRFLRALTEGLDRGELASSFPALVIVDLHRFGRFNEVLGQAAGDEILAEVGQRLTIAAGPGNPVGSLGGDEFAVLLADVQGDDLAEQRAERLLACLDRPLRLEGRHINLRACAGVACDHDNATSADALLQAAQLAVRAAKSAGPGTIRSFQPVLRQQRRERTSLLDDLQRALGRRELRMVFQPIVSVRDRRPVGFESLLRWRRDGAEVSPALFVPLAEEAGLMGPISRWVLRQAVREVAQWRAAFGPHLYVSVNLSARDLESPDLPGRIDDELERHALSPAQLALEVTETSVLDRPGLPARLSGLRQRGIRVMLDDFGTGFSTLQSLVELQCDTLKVDRSFVKLATEGQTAFLEAVVHLARRTGKTVVAEGVEDAVALRRLLTLGADCAQGWAIARPLEADQVLPWLQRGLSELAVSS